MRKSYDVIVIGAGITGASTAYHLKKEGIEHVLLLERRRPAAGGTGKSAAVIRQHYSTPVLVRLTREGIAIFRALPEETGADAGYVAAGWFFLVPAEAQEAARRNVAMQRSCGVDTRFLEEREIAERMPWLDPEGVAGVVFEAEGGYADPVRATEAFIKGFRDQGGEMHVNTPVRQIRREGDRVTGVVTEEGPIAADAVVNAAGPWAKALAEFAGIEMRIRAVREQDTVWEARAGRPLPESSISNAVDAIYLRPLGERRYVVGRGFPKPYVDVDPENLKESADEAFVAEVQERLERRFPPFAGARCIDAYAALYDVTPDWYPFLGPRAGLTGYHDACGGSGHGFKLGPAAGRHLARWIATGVADPEFAKLSYDRIAAGELFTQAYGGNRG
jgi:glycine/D-amino acid oxidase-like deaminating enzyme